MALEENAGLIFALAMSMLGASLSLYITSLFVRGYGEIVQNSNLLAQKADEIIARLPAPEIPEPSVFDQVCSAVEESIK